MSLQIKCLFFSLFLLIFIKEISSQYSTPCAHNDPDACNSGEDPYLVCKNNICLCKDNMLREEGKNRCVHREGLQCGKGATDEENYEPCVTNSNCKNVSATESICVCDEEKGYIKNPVGFCWMSYGKWFCEDGRVDNRCNSDLGLICNEQKVCMCRVDLPSAWNPNKNICKRIIGSICTSSEDCFSDDMECSNNKCECKNGKLPDSEGKFCYLGHDEECSETEIDYKNCNPMFECSSKKDMTTDSPATQLPTTTITTSTTTTMSPSSDPPLFEDEYDIDNEIFASTSEPEPEPTTSEQPDPDPGLKKCYCRDNYFYDPIKNDCLGLAGADCSGGKSCNANSVCANGVCTCVAGYEPFSSNAGTLCKAIYGTTCNLISSNLCAEDHYLDCRNNATCDCKASYEYNNDEKRCKGKVRQGCKENADCISNFCQNNSRLCDCPLGQSPYDFHCYMDHKGNCSRSENECNPEKLLMCRSSECTCLVIDNREFSLTPPESETGSCIALADKHCRYNLFDIPCVANSTCQAKNPGIDDTRICKCMDGYVNSNGLCIPRTSGAPSISFSILILTFSLFFQFFK